MINLLLSKCRFPFFYGISVKVNTSLTPSYDAYENSLFNLVAQDLDIDMREYWVPDELFLKKRNMTQLQDIVSQSQTSHLFGTVGGYKKSDIVSILSKYFADLNTSEELNEDQKNARSWLPEAFGFPAIDPERVMDEIVEEEHLDMAA